MTLILDRPGEEIREVIESALPDLVRWILTPDAIFVSGGFVRDACVGHPYNDIDIFGATRAQFMEIAREARKRFDIVHGTISDKNITLQTMVFGMNTDGTSILAELRTIQLIWNLGIDKFDLACNSGMYDLTNLYTASPMRSGRMALCPHNISPRTFDRMLRLYRKGWEAGVEEFAMAAKVAETLSLGDY